MSPARTSDRVGVTGGGLSAGPRLCRVCILLRSPARKPPRLGFLRRGPGTRPWGEGPPPLGRPGQASTSPSVLCRCTFWLSLRDREWPDQPDTSSPCSAPQRHTQFQPHGRTRHTTHVYRRHAKAVSQRGGSSPQGAGPGAPGQVAAGTRRRPQASRLAPPAVGAHRCLPRARPDATVSAQTQHEGLGHRGGPAGGGDLDIACCCQRVQARPSSQHVSSASDGESATLRALCPSGWGRADSPPG